MLRSRGAANVEYAGGIQAELKRSRVLLRQWLSQYLNRFFDLSASGAVLRRMRMTYAVLGLAGAAICIHLLLQSGAWVRLGSQLDLMAGSEIALVALLRAALILGICASVCARMAGDFLADVFEIADQQVAERHVLSLAFGIGTQVLHLREGKIAEEDRNSPILLIGGPGLVQVDFDTAALFEKSDGTPHVVGPSRAGANASKRGSAATQLEGFERLREPLIDLRDQYIGSPSGEPLAVTGRSLDGLPVSVADVRGLFSVRRQPPEEQAEPTTEPPYPFRAADIENLIYKQVVPVLTGGEHPSEEPGAWTSTMEDLIRASLIDFMSQNRLGEFFAGTASQEVELSEFRQDTILARSMQLSDARADVGTSSTAAQPKFLPRTDLSNKFKRYSGEFSRKAEERGLQLHWIGVGTWKLPDENATLVVNQKHLEAWSMNRENTRRSDAGALNRVAQAAMLDEKARLIRETPLASHEANAVRYSSRPVLLECLLQDFLEQLGTGLSVAYKNQAGSVELNNLEEAVLRLEELLKIPEAGLFIRGRAESRVRPSVPTNGDADAPPAPASRVEAAKYRALLSKVEGNYKVAEAMIENESRRHADLSREELITRIVQRIERHGH